MKNDALTLLAKGSYAVRMVQHLSSPHIRTLNLVVVLKLTVHMIFEKLYSSSKRNLRMSHNSIWIRFFVKLRASPLCGL